MYVCTHIHHFTTTPITMMQDEVKAALARVDLLIGRLASLYCVSASDRRWNKSRPLTRYQGGVKLPDGETRSAFI